MDGILGIGLAELVLISLITILVAGPKTTLRWAYQAGQYVKQFQNWWQEVTADLRKEVNQELSVLEETKQEIKADLAEVETTADPNTLLAETTEDINNTLQEINTDLEEAKSEVVKQHGTLRSIKNREPAKKKPWLAYRDD